MVMAIRPIFPLRRPEGKAWKQRESWALNDKVECKNEFGHHSSILGAFPHVPRQRHKLRPGYRRARVCNSRNNTRNSSGGLQRPQDVSICQSSWIKVEEIKLKKKTTLTLTYSCVNIHNALNASCYIPFSVKTIMFLVPVQTSYVWYHDRDSTIWGNNG